ncbi:MULTISPECIES: hypothetical protein [Curtobacterium]|uniref:hypothetical protein n=1 Tax=Curtobacterium flaccumfaciens TaxID=2035 RepID=UPI003EE66462
MTQTPGSPAAADGHPQLGSVHKNGDRRFGIRELLASVYAGRGTPQASNLYRSSVTEHMRDVRVGDELCVKWDGAHWWASSVAGTVGRLTWSKNFREETAYVTDGRSPYDFDDGTLHVRSVTVSAAGEVVNCGGYVVPDDYEPSDWPMTPMPDPAERELTVTVRFPVPAPGQSPVPEASTETKARPGWLHRLLGREREGEQR